MKIGTISSLYTLWLHVMECGSLSIVKNRGKYKMRPSKKLFYSKCVLVRSFFFTKCVVINYFFTQNAFDILFASTSQSIFTIRMHFNLALYFADNKSIGRVDYSSLPQQALMEIMAESIDDKRIFQDNDGNFLEISEWVGVVTNAQWESY